MAKNNQVRVQFNFSKEALERVDEMRNASGATTRAEVLRAALAYYEWILMKNEQGLRIAAVDSKTKQVEEMLSPLLSFRLYSR